MRKTIAFMLMIFLFIVSFPLTSVSAQVCDIELSAVQNVPGSIDVTVAIKNNPGFASFVLKVYFDNKKLEPNSVRREGSILPISGSFSNNLTLPNITYVQTHFMSAPPHFSDITEDGILYTIRFKIKESTSGCVVFYLDNNCDIISQSETDVSYTSETGRFSITESPVEIMFTGSSISVSDGIWSGSVKGLILERSDVAPVVQQNNAIILTAYDSSHRLIYTRFETLRSLSEGGGQVIPMQFNPGQPFTISDLTIPAKDGKSLELKLFLWSSIEQMQPLAENDARIITAPKKGVLQ